ncbi:MAG: hypothetical protein MJ097_03735, partial [Dorea sp.]|nr:hypothetical protein [Dorea sp.]
ADDSYMKSLEADLKEAEKAVANLVKVIEKGVMSDAVLTRLTEMEERQKAIMEAIETEKIKKSLADNTSSIQKYFDMYMHADFDDDETRNTLLEYFVDKIYVYDDKLVITWFYSDDHAEIDLDALTECTEDESAEGSTLSCSGPLYHFILVRRKIAVSRSQLFFFCIFTGKT